MKDRIFYKVFDTLLLYRECKEIISIKQVNDQNMLENLQKFNKLDQQIKEIGLQHKSDIKQLSEINKSYSSDILRTKQAEIEKIKVLKEQDIQKNQDKHNKLEFELNQIAISFMTQNQKLYYYKITMKYQKEIKELQKKINQEKFFKFAMANLMLIIKHLIFNKNKKYSSKYIFKIQIYFHNKEIFKFKLKSINIIQSINFRHNLKFLQIQQIVPKNLNRFYVHINHEKFIQQVYNNGNRWYLNKRLQIRNKKNFNIRNIWCLRKDQNLQSSFEIVKKKLYIIFKKQDYSQMHNKRKFQIVPYLFFDYHKLNNLIYTKILEKVQENNKQTRVIRNLKNQWIVSSTFKCYYIIQQSFPKIKQLIFKLRYRCHRDHTQTSIAAKKLQHTCKKTEGTVTINLNFMHLMKFQITVIVECGEQFMVKFISKSDKLGFCSIILLFKKLRKYSTFVGSIIII
ncbi:unnamed protein product [Paramecium pentaurelia]|uniref:Uncharacterized protein n=1 Tax=Paramecium pentaurelia TaxID=43138 RepID=A0A8S1YIW6_9CILI|nr:unnamed protein product [Paramecium pentaurelia]